MILCGGGFCEMGAGHLVGAEIPEWFPGRCVVQRVGFPLWYGLHSRFRPELHNSLHAVVEQFDYRFDGTRSDRRSLLAVLRVIHPRLLVLQIGQCLSDNAAVADRAVFVVGRANLLLSFTQSIRRDSRLTQEHV